MNKRLKSLLQNRFVKAAEALVANPEGLKFKLEKLSDFLNAQTVVKALGKQASTAFVFFRMVKNWFLGKYKEIPTKQIVLILSSLLYLMTPADLMPDFIIGLGLVDDLAVLNWVYGQVKDEVKKFKQWEET